MPFPALCLLGYFNERYYQETRKWEKERSNFSVLFFLFFFSLFSSLSFISLLSLSFPPLFFSWFLVRQKGPSCAVKSWMLRQPRQQCAPDSSSNCSHENSRKLTQHLSALIPIVSVHSCPLAPVTKITGDFKHANFYNISVAFSHTHEYRQTHLHCKIN